MRGALKNSVQRRDGASGEVLFKKTEGRGGRIAYSFEGGDAFSLDIDVGGAGQWVGAWKRI